MRGFSNSGAGPDQTYAEMAAEKAAEKERQDREKAEAQTADQNEKTDQ